MTCIEIEKSLLFSRIEIILYVVDKKSNVQLEAKDLAAEFRNLFQTTSYADQAREVIRHMILTGTYGPGQRLKEMDISQELGISRSPIREAVQGLANEGLVKIVPQKGAFVASFDIQEVGELYEVREALEVMAVRLAADRAEDHRVEELEEFLEATKATLDSHQATGYPRDLDFHKKVAELSQNRKLAQKIAEINSQLGLVRLRSASKPGRALQAYEEHIAIFEALRQRDSKKAVRAMRGHIHNGRANMLSTLRAGDNGAA